MRSGRSKPIWLLLSAGAAFALLAWSAERPHQQPAAVRVGVAPHVRAVDAPPPALVGMMLRAELGLSQAGSVSTGIDTVCTPSPCKAADVAQAQGEFARHQEAIRPAPGTRPRTVAELPGAGVLLAWRNRVSQLCLDAARPAGGGGSVFGPCAGDRQNPCTAICLVSDGSGPSLAQFRYLLAGTVSAHATALRITTSRARTIYPLRGPILRGTDRRVFMLDLGRGDYRLLELLQAGHVVDSRSLPAVQAAFEDCQAAHPAMNDFKACVQGAGAMVPAPSFP